MKALCHLLGLQSNQILRYQSHTKTKFFTLRLIISYEISLKKKKM